VPVYRVFSHGGRLNGTAFGGSYHGLRQLNNCCGRRDTQTPLFDIRSIMERSGVAPTAAPSSSSPFATSSLFTCRSEP